MIVLPMPKFICVVNSKHKTSAHEKEHGQIQRNQRSINGRRQDPRPRVKAGPTFNSHEVQFFYPIPMVFSHHRRAVFGCPQSRQDIRALFETY